VRFDKLSVKTAVAGGGGGGSGGGAMRGRWVNCCDQDALVGVLEHDAQTDDHRTLPHVIWPPRMIPECGTGVRRPQVLAVHYNCIGSETSSDRMLDKAREMRRNRQWLVTNGTCAGFPESGRKLLRMHNVTRNGVRRVPTRAGTAGYSTQGRYNRLLGLSRSRRAGGTASLKTLRTL